MAPVQVEKPERTEQDGIGQARRCFEEIQTPDPRDRAESHLEAARPIHADLGGIGVHPGHEVLDERRRVAFIVCVPVRLAERHEVLMTIELPNELVFPGDFGVEVIDPTPMATLDSCPRDRITVPIDRSTTVQARAAEQVELPTTHLVSEFDDAGLELRPTPAQEIEHV